MPDEIDSGTLDVLQNIEFFLKTIYEGDPTLSDLAAMLALRKARVAIKQKFGFGRGMNGNPENETEKRIIDAVVEIGLARIGKINDLTLNAFDKCIDKVAQSVDRHRVFGERGYYEFIKDYV